MKIAPKKAKAYDKSPIFTSETVINFTQTAAIPYAKSFRSLRSWKAAYLGVYKF